MATGLEYARWLTEKSGKRWRFRLPTDLEWEKAARGADRRIYVWGNYPIWSFCSSVKGNYRESKGPPETIGRYPMDESVYGVRDMAGSMYEPTSDKTTRRYRYTSLRGGNWYTTEDQYFRIANRNGRTPESAGIDCGLRLVAELGRPAE